MIPNGAEPEFSAPVVVSGFGQLFPGSNAATADLCRSSANCQGVGGRSRAARQVKRGRGEEKIIPLVLVTRAGQGVQIEHLAQRHSQVHDQSMMQVVGLALEGEDFDRGVVTNQRGNAGVPEEFGEGSSAAQSGNPRLPGDFMAKSWKGAPVMHPTGAEQQN